MHVSTHFKGSRIMSNGLCGGGAALMTVQRAMKGKQRGNCFPKAGRAKEKEFGHYIFIAFLYYKYSLNSIFFIRNTSFPCEEDTWLWRVQCHAELIIWRANSSPEYLDWKRDWDTSRSCLRFLQESQWLSPSLKIIHDCLLRASMCKQGEELQPDRSRAEFALKP